MNAAQSGWWTVTLDMTDDTPRQVAVVGPRECTLTSQQIEQHPMSKPFELFDDDGNLYYTGFCILPAGLTADAFRPLDDYGAPNAGAVTIRYRVSGALITL